MQVDDSNVTLVGSNLLGNRAQTGGAIHVSGTSAVRVQASSLIENSAAVSGGAMHVEGGWVELRDRALVDRNTAPEGHGSSIYLASQGSLLYTLPTPPARYLFIRQGDTFELKSGAEDADFPYVCPAGVVGGTSPEEQSGPACSRPW